jgi:ring-1,2-phenylacetyl-CoA epoxidase subunit PaaC
MADDDRTRTDDPRTTLLLALADDELITGHRLGEWTGWVPYIEEDLALSSIGQDELGHARALYEIAVTLGAAPDVDTLAFGRLPDEYRNAHVCERPNEDFAYTIARHWLYDTADDVRTATLAGSTFKEMAALMAVVRLEEAYHVEHARTWFARLAEGPVDARSRFASALIRIFPEALALFEPLPGEDALVAEGTMPDPSETMLSSWLERVGADLESAGLERVLESRAETPVGELVPTSSGAAEPLGTETTPLHVPGLERREDGWVHRGGFAGAGGRRGVRSPDFEALWQEMTGLYRAHPGASW